MRSESRNLQNGSTRSRGWIWPFSAAVLALIGASVAITADWYSSHPPDAVRQARYVGRQACVTCHQTEHSLWTDSHHDLAMDLATDKSVLANFNNVTFERLGVTTRFFRRDGKFWVNTEGPDGQFRDYEVKYTFGVTPLQQYMVEFPDGRVQVLRESWDTLAKKWFFVPPPDAVNERILPGDPTHWTGLSQNWNTYCAECHSTQLNKGYNAKSDTYETTFSEIDVSCEECHGPGSLHVELAGSTSLFWDRNNGLGLAPLKSQTSQTQIETCAKCHSRRSHVHDYLPRQPGDPLLDYFEPSRLSEGLYHADGQILDEVYEYGSFAQSKMHAKGIRCSDCHNPHSLKIKHPGNRLCAQCHVADKYDTVSHHHHPAGGAGAQCVDCHMPTTHYMVVDPRLDHSIRNPRPDLTVSIGTPNACNGCHTKPEENANWAATKVVEWFGPQRVDDPHWAPAISAGRQLAEGGDTLLAEVIRREATPPIVRATAIDLLSGYSTNTAVTQVEAELDNLHPLVRLAAVEGVTAGSAPELIDRLTPRLRDSSRAVRIAAGVRLMSLGQPALPPQVMEALRPVIAEYREQLAFDLERAPTHINLAAIAQFENDLPRTCDELRAAIRLEPYLTGPRGELAILLERSGGSAAEVRKLRIEEVELLERDAKLIPNAAAIQFRLGLLRYQLQQFPAAEQALACACELDPRTYVYLEALASLQELRFERERDPQHAQRALATLDRMRKLDPSRPETREIATRLLEYQRRLSAEASANPGASDSEAP